LRASVRRHPTRAERLVDASLDPTEARSVADPGLGNCVAGVLGAGAAASDDLCAAAFDLILATNAPPPSGLSARELGERAEVEARARRIAHLLIDGMPRREWPEVR
jgi:hypothetical protein